MTGGALCDRLPGDRSVSNPDHSVPKAAANMNIGEAARLSGVPAKTIRYYESVGLLPAGPRRDNGYRDYGAAEVDALRFVRRARSLGFSVQEAAALLGFQRDAGRAGGDVRELARRHIAEIDAKTAELAEMRAVLAALVDRCPGGADPDCPILDALAGGAPAGRASGSGRRERCASARDAEKTASS